MSLFEEDDDHRTLIADGPSYLSGLCLIRTTRLALALNVDRG